MGEGGEKKGNTHRRKGESVARDVRSNKGRKTNKACRWQTLSILRWENFSEKKEDEWPVAVFIGKGGEELLVGHDRRARCVSYAERNN